MVEDLTKKGYKCPYCNKFFENYNDALSCAEDCIDIESPEEDTITQFKCEMCFHIFEESQKKKLKKSWRKMILKAVNLSDGDEKHDFVA